MANSMMSLNQNLWRASRQVWLGLTVSLLLAVNADTAVAWMLSWPITHQEKSEPPRQEPPRQEPPAKEAIQEQAKQDTTPPRTSPPANATAARPAQDGDKQTLSDDDVQMFFNPKFSDTNLPVRAEEAWTPPTPIDWSIAGIMELNFDHLKFNIKPDDPFEVRQLTLDLLKLRGRTIKIRGYIRPSFKEKNITRFVFVRDNQECCFGPGAALYDSMIVNMAAGHSVNFSTRPVTLEGRFKLSPLRGPDDRVWAIFELNESVLK